MKTEKDEEDKKKVKEYTVRLRRQQGKNVLKISIPQ